MVRIGPTELHFIDADFNLAHHRDTSLYKDPIYYGPVRHVSSGMEDPRHHKIRKFITQPLFTGQTLRRFSSSTLNQHLDTLQKNLINAAADNGGKVNLTYLISAFSNDVMFSYIMDEDFGFQRKPNLQTVHDTTRVFSAIDLATVLRAFSFVRLAFDFLPCLRNVSRLGWLDRVGPVCCVHCSVGH